jgi:predicted nuclease of restriction endonuclease-like RecB superfamily
VNIAKKESKAAMRSVPPALHGRPRKDELASQVIALFEQGKTPGQIANQLKPKYPDINKESVRKLLVSRHVRRAEKKP